MGYILNFLEFVFIDCQYFNMQSVQHKNKIPSIYYLGINNFNCIGVLTVKYIFFFYFYSTNTL